MLAVLVEGGRRVLVANLGDSAGVLCRNGGVLELSNAHKPDRPDELDRILAANGWITEVRPNIQSWLALGHTFHLN